MTKLAVGRTVRRLVRRRANDRCEYCRMPRGLDAAPFHVDHVRPRQQGGTTTLDNLAFCCPSCNLHKGTNVAGTNPATGRLGRLFNPRVDDGDEHFRWSGSRLVGRTARGRATVRLLAVNEPVTIELRGDLIGLGLF